MAYIDSTGVLSLGAINATGITIGNSATPITFASGSTCTFTGVATAGLNPPGIGGANQISFNNGTTNTGDSTFTYIPGATPATTGTLAVTTMSITGQQLNADGTRTAPSYTFAGDTTSGLYLGTAAGLKTGPTFSVGGFDRSILYYNRVVTPPTAGNPVVVTIFSASIAAMQTVGLVIEYYVDSHNASTTQSAYGTAIITAVADASATPIITAGTVVVTGSVLTVSAGTLVLAWTAVGNTGTATVDIKLSITPSILATNLSLAVNVRNLSPLSVLTGFT